MSGQGSPLQQQMAVSEGICKPIDPLPTTADATSTSTSIHHRRKQWRRLQQLLFLLTIPGAAMDVAANGSATPSVPPLSSSWGYTFSLLWRSAMTSTGSSMEDYTIDNSRKSSSPKHTLLRSQYSSVSTSVNFEAAHDAGDEFSDFYDYNTRELKSSDSNSHDSHDEHDDFWRNPDYWDDYIGNNRNDDFYKYIGDPAQPSLLPLTRRDVVGFMLASLGATLGSSGGIGGGGLVVPCYIIAMGMNPKQAFPLGSVTVLGGSLAGLMLNLRRRHPLADRPIIDWDLILVMEPLVLVGALFGSILHRVISEKVLSVLLVFLLSTVAHTTLAKAKRMFDAERRYIEHLKTARSDYLSRVASFKTAFRMSEAGWSADALPGTDPESKTVTASYMPPSPVRTQSLDSRSMNTTHVSPRIDFNERQRILILNPDFVTLRSDLLEEERATPCSKILALFAKFSVLMFLNLSLGGGAFRSPWGIECGGLAYWVIHVIMVAFLISSAWAAQTYLVNRHELKEIIRFDYVYGDIKWDLRTAIIYPFFFILAGLCAGMFGIGGGMITVPLMLTMGVHPAICTATSSTMVFFTALLSASSFAVFNLILWDYAIVCFCVGFIGSLVGLGIMQKARQTSTAAANFERNSFIAYCTGCVIMLCALLMTVQYVMQLVGFDKNISYSEEGGLCEGYRIG